MNISPQVFLYQSGQPPSPLPENWIALSQVPSNSFGDGNHPTTRICAGAVDFLCRTSPGTSVLDVGTGTGVLARIARARGAKFVAGTDIDPSSLAAAQINAALDSHPLKIEILNAPPDHWGARFELVVANILEGPLRELAPQLSKALVPGGRLLLSGFTRIQISGLRVAFEGCGLTYVSEAQLDGWALLMMAAPTIRA